jgi:phosphatidate cytidylyltransferase
MSNLPKRILTSLIIFPLSIFFIFKGGNLLLLFLLVVFVVSNYELFLVFNKRITILCLDLVLILSLFSIYYLRESGEVSTKLLIWVIILCVCSDTGGYVFGKTFKWKKITEISPNKTLSGVLGSFIFSLFSLFIVENVSFTSSAFIQFLEPKFFFLAVIFSLVAQIGDLTISFFKRLEDVKDTGKILPGHGGIFDRIDGLMFVVILALLLIQFNIIP